MSADDALYDWIVEKWFPSELTKADRSRIGKLVRDLKIKRATIESFERALKNYRQAWPSMSDTPEAIVKHWDRMIADIQLTPTVTPGVDPKDVEARRQQSEANRWYFGVLNEERIKIWKRVAVHVLEKHNEAKVKAIESDFELRILSMWLYEVRGVR
ncbi:hypothetical protein LCGC14_1742410 [marine sediment metagenome]|uniref:Uncharacterized protein n=1 Tax=marine sediment metagenome TaxID=412755 RepID=A0A0F9K5Z3_9ZZZZ